MNSGTLSISGSAFLVNSATGGLGSTSGGDAHGGGIDNSGTLTITGSAFDGDLAKSGLDSFGGGIYNSGTLTITGSGFGDDSAKSDLDSFGGGIYNSGTLSVATTSFGSLAEGDFESFGGGIDNSGTLSVTNSEFDDNSAKGQSATPGAAASTDYGYGGAIANSGALSVTNSTISDNSVTGVDGSFGGGIADSGTVSITYVTTDDNSAATGGGVAITSGAQSVVDSIDSIFQNTQGGNIAVVAGSFTSVGHNLFSDDPDVSLGPTDLVNTDPLLGPLTSNGGPYQTQALLTDSPAINAGIPVSGITTDQRGAPRPLSGTTDIGAFQVQPPLTVVSLRRARANHQPTDLVLTFNLPLDASRAESLANYRIVQSSANERVISIRSAQYNATSQSVTLRPKTRLSPSQTYVLTVIGTPPGGLTTAVGAYLAGAGNGEPGSNYVAAIS